MLLLGLLPTAVILVGIIVDAQRAGADVPLEALSEEGRFIPYWFRDHDDNTQLRLEPLVDMESSLYYQSCKELFLKEGRALPMVTEPYIYVGKMIVEQTFPIVIDGEFKGIAATDRALSDIESFLQEIKERDAAGRQLDDARVRRDRPRPHHRPPPGARGLAGARSGARPGGPRTNGRGAPRLVLLDLMMPVMDGFDFIHAVREHAEWREVPIVVVTARELTADERRFIEGSTQRLLEKSAGSVDSALAELTQLVRDAAGTDRR